VKRKGILHPSTEGGQSRPTIFSDPRIASPSEAVRCSLRNGHEQILNHDSSRHALRA